MYYIFWYLQKAFDFLWFINKYLKKVSKKISTACIPDASILAKGDIVRAFASRTTQQRHCCRPCAWRADGGHGAEGRGVWCRWERNLSCRLLKSSCSFFLFTCGLQTEMTSILKHTRFLTPTCGASSQPAASQAPLSYDQVKEGDIKSLQWLWSLGTWTWVVGVTQKRDPNPNEAKQSILKRQWVETLVVFVFCLPASTESKNGWKETLQQSLLALSSGSQKCPSQQGGEACSWPPLFIRTRKEWSFKKEKQFPQLNWWHKGQEGRRQTNFNDKTTRAMPCARGVMDLLLVSTKNAVESVLILKLSDNL